MKSNGRHQFRIASTAEEFAAIHRLNYRTFVQEIPQHATNPEESLVDRFHEQNVYVICLDGDRLAGMLAIRFEHPFSLEEKLGDLAAWLPPGRTWCEMRLLAVEPAYRGTAVMTGLLQSAAAEAMRRGCDSTMISATTRQLRLYGHVGFTPFARLVGREGAWFQPMYLLLEIFRRRAPLLAGLEMNRDALLRIPRQPVNLLPGPVRTLPSVREAFCREPVSHRSVGFGREVQALRRALASLTGAAHASLMPGSGTLANEVICARLRLENRPGLVVSFGEFGERLADHARRAGLSFRHQTLPWGESPGPAKWDAWFDRHPEAGWLWTTHCETSTGALIPLDHIRSECARRGIRLCLDCVSTIGILPLDLRGVHLASCSSGKGLASLPGVAIVLHDAPVAPEPARIPRYLDLGLYAADDGLPFTQNANLVLALKAAMDGTDWPEKRCRIRGIGDELRRRCGEVGLPVLGGLDEAGAFSPAVLTVALPEPVSSTEFAHAMEHAGWWLSAHSGYLRRRNWVQICLMGDMFAGDLSDLPSRLARCLQRMEVDRRPREVQSMTGR